MSDGKPRRDHQRAKRVLRHYSYECKAAAQDRPYVTRPSRTQQLADPTLVPKLSSDIPNDLLRKKGVADEQLAKIEEDRKHQAKVEDFPYGSGNRSISTSSRSLTSVSTISTNMSRSPSRERGIRHKASRTHETLKAAKHCRRKSSRERSMSENSVSPYHKDPAKAPRNNDQDTRSRQQPYSPNDGGRERSSGRQMRNVTLGSSHKRRRSLSSSMSCTSGSSYGGRRRHGPVDNDRRTRPRRSSMSPDVRGRDRWSRAPRNSRKSRSRTNSMDRSRIARERRSMTPDRASRGDKDRRRRDGFGVAGGQSGYAKDNDRYGSSFRGKEHEHSTAPKPVSLPRKERSLSPFSKRLALTQAMNMGI